MSTVPGSARAERRAVLAAFLSFLVPGLGQAYNGQRSLAWVLVTPVLLLVAGVVLVLVAVGAGGILSRLLDIRVLIGLVVLDLALLGWRVLAIAQAHGRRSPLASRGWTTWLTGGLLVATLAMHLLPGYYAWKTIDTVTAVALGGTGGGGLVEGIGRIPGRIEISEPSTQPDVRHGERVNILLVGVDAGPGRAHALTDTMLVVSLDTDSGRPAMISLPRDLYGVPLPDGRTYNAKLNGLMQFASARPQEFPRGGVETLKATIGGLLGVDIHYFAAINLLGFMEAIDAVGGVEVTVERTINDPLYNDEFGQRVGFYLAPGTYLMDGELALAFVRSRKGVGDNDFVRADRQQQLLQALRDKLTAGNLVLALPGLLDAVASTVATDVPSARLPELAQAIQDADMSTLNRVVLQPPEHMRADPYSAAGYILIPDLDAIRAVGAELLGEPPADVDAAAGE